MRHKNNNFRGIHSRFWLYFCWLCHKFTVAAAEMSPDCNLFSAKACCWSDDCLYTSINHIYGIEFVINTVFLHEFVLFIKRDYV